MARIYIDRRDFAESDRKWVSFESDPKLEKTKSDIYGRCVPCITNLYEQLQAGKPEIELGMAHQCWKIVIQAESLEECINFLEIFERNSPEDMHVRGRFGSVDESKSTKVIVFNTESDEERDRLHYQLKACAALLGPQSAVTYHRACAELFHELLGPWEEWGETQPIKKPEMVKPLLKRIREILFWERKV